MLSNADALSRLPRSITTSSDCISGDLIHLIHHLFTVAINADKIKERNKRDPILSMVYYYISSGWPNNVDESLHPYWTRKDELSVLKGCILWDTCVIVPPPGRQHVLNELHDPHLGCCKMKALAHSYIWWPKMDAEIEMTVKLCTICQENQPSPPSFPVREWAKQPWSRLHLDFAGR